MNIIIVGCGKVGSALAEQLADDGHDITVIDTNAEAVRRVTDTADVMGIVGNGAVHLVQQEAGIKYADMFIVMTNSDELNLLCCMIAKRASDCKTIARVRNPVYINESSFIKEKLGISMIINPELVAASEMARLFSIPSAIEVDTFERGRIELLKTEVPEKSPIAGVQIKSALGKLSGRILICAVERDDRVIIPTGDDYIYAGDKISFITTHKDGTQFFKKAGIANEHLRSVIIVGGGKIAIYLTQKLCEYGFKVKVIEKDKAQCEYLNSILPANVLIINGDGSDQRLLLEEGIAEADGFAIHNASIGFYNSYYLQGVVTVFMILFGVNFSVYYLLLLKKFGQAVRSEELRWYLGIISFSVLCITLNIYKANFGGKLFPAFHHAAFSVASIISTTGFATTDFNDWPQLSKLILVFLMFIGASAGSTGGGIKVSRIILLVKSSLREISSVIHPRGVKIVKLDKKRIDHETLRGTTSFFVVCMLVFVISAFTVSLDGHDMTTSLTAVAATMNNIGPGLELVGPTGNYNSFSPLSKIILIFDMLAGRLEYFPMLVLFSPTTWKGTVGAVKRRILWKKKTMRQKVK